MIFQQINIESDLNANQMIITVQICIFSNVYHISTQLRIRKVNFTGSKRMSYTILKMKASVSKEDVTT